MNGNLAQVIGLLVEKAAEERSANLPCMDLDAARAILSAAYAHWNEWPKFEPGDILKVAPHSGTWKKTLGHVMVVRVFDPESTVDEASHRVTTTNMRVLAVGDTGAVAEFEVHSRDFDLVERKAVP